MCFFAQHLKLFMVGIAPYTLHSTQVPIKQTHTHTHYTNRDKKAFIFLQFFVIVFCGIVVRGWDSKSYINVNREKKNGYT